jgi:hypothetical protein
VVPGDELDHPKGIGRMEWLEDEGAAREVAEESCFCFPSEPCPEKVRDLRDDEGGDDQRTGMCREQFEAGGVVRVVGVDVRVEGAGVDDQRDGVDSARMISSTRSEMSLRPLRPAAAAFSLRRAPAPPRCASRAARVISAIVVPRR